MAIKIPKTPAMTPVGGVESVDPSRQAGRARRVGFGDQLSARPATTQADPVRTAVHDVAGEIAAGRIARGPASIEAVIQRIVTATAGPDASPRELKARTQELQATLGHDPNFTARVERRLDAAIAAIAEA